MAEEPAAAANAATVFLSYARADEVFARRLALVLQNAGYTVWWDALIEGGAAFSRSIADALESADVVLVLWSKTSVDSDWVKDEAAQGRERHRLIPLSIDGTLPPLGFRQYQVIEIAHWHGRRTSPQFAAIERAIASAIGQVATVAGPSRAAVSRRGLLVGGSAAAIAVVGGASWFAWDRGLLGGRTALSIAVLPFRNLSGDRAQDYFADGLTEEVRTALTRIAALQVLAGTSSEKVQGDDSPKAIAAELDVGFLLTGSVQRAEKTVRIAIDLADGRTGFSRWSQSVDRKLTDIFAVQSEIARMVAQAMSVQVATSEPAPGGTSNVQAYEHYLQGRAQFNLAKDEETDRAALANFEMAIAEDPKFALAHAARSRSLSVIAGEHATAEEIKLLYSEAIAAARRAVELAPNLAEGHLALAYAIFAGKLDIRGAWPSYQQAYRLGYGNADIALLYALYCSRAGRPAEAKSAVERAVLLDPLNPRAWRAQGSVAYAARRYSDALAPLRRALQLNPKITFAHSLAGNSLLGLGRTADALKEFEAEPEAQFRLTGIAIAQDRRGDRAAAEKAFADLQSQVGDAAVYQQAEVLAQWGRADESLRKLGRAREVGDSGLTYAATDVMLDPLRRDPRFQRFLNEMSLG
ncbi:MAG TPA: TIR domain-containing protein [Sphingomicrobium sp.]|jgi:TolB-like protein/tetratricopeptide (TPR) repeat protein